MRNNACRLPALRESAPSQPARMADRMGAFAPTTRVRPGEVRLRHRETADRVLRPASEVTTTGPGNDRTHETISPWSVVNLRSDTRHLSI
jgi:hypothetical protein